MISPVRDERLAAAGMSPLVFCKMSQHNSKKNIKTLAYVKKKQ